MLKLQKRWMGIGLAAAVMLAACAPATPAETAMMATPTEAAVMATPAETAMMETPTEAAMLETPAEAAMMETPAWLSTALIDVNTDAVFNLADYHGQVVLVEMLAVWCPKCLEQQRQVQALHLQLGPRDDFVSVGLAIDPNETADILRAHTRQRGFDWTYAVAPREVAREIAGLYGDQFLNPPSTPMLIIDRQGQAHPLPFGIKDVDALVAAVRPFLEAAQ